MEKDVAALIRRVKRYARAAGCAESVASLKVFNDGKRLLALQSGSKMWPETLKEANEKLEALEAEIAAQ